MGMQADPTVVYALQKAGSITTATSGRKTSASTRRTTPTNAPDSRPGRLPRRGRPRSPQPSIPPTRRSSICQPQRRLTRVRHDAGRTQSKRSGIPGAIFSKTREGARGAIGAIGARVQGAPKLFAPLALIARFAPLAPSIDRIVRPTDLGRLQERIVVPVVLPAGPVTRRG